MAAPMICRGNSLLFINVYFNTEYTEGTEKKSERRNGRGSQGNRDKKLAAEKTGRRENIR
jgi:hypothetical protein